MQKCRRCGQEFAPQNFHLPLGICHGCVKPADVPNPVLDTEDKIEAHLRNIYDKESARRYSACNGESQR